MGWTTNTLCFHPSGIKVLIRTVLPLLIFRTTNCFYFGSFLSNSACSFFYAHIRSSIQFERGGGPVWALLGSRGGKMALRRRPKAPLGHAPAEARQRHPEPPFRVPLWSFGGRMSQGVLELLRGLLLAPRPPVLPPSSPYSLHNLVIFRFGLPWWPNFQTVLPYCGKFSSISLSMPVYCVLPCGAIQFSLSWQW